MVPDKNARDYAESSAPAREELNGPTLHATDEMRRLATPWPVAIARAKLVASTPLAPGLILDPACGSATQLAALCTHLNRSGLGVELSGAAAPLAAINLERSATWAGGDWTETSRILWGDGTVADSILQTYHQNIGATTPVALLHIDPARPQDAQQHTLEEMQPRLDHILASWTPFLPKEPAIILDLSPRLSDAQRMEVDELVSSIWNNIPRTWQWMTQGRGRVDRLSLWVGPVADSKPHRLARLSSNGELSLLSGTPENSVVGEPLIEVGNHLTIVDPSLIASGLAESWRNLAAKEGSSDWLKLTGRRPKFISSQALPNLGEIRDFIQISGEIVETAPEISFETLSILAAIAHAADLSNLKLRCRIDPDLQPKLQSALDREIKQFESTSAATQGFITEAGEGYVICRQA
jgi:cell division protein ZapA (FtsZ GTPase activity inhibitor)